MTDPPRATPGELRCMRRVTNDDRRHRPLLVWPLYTMCRRASIKAYVMPA